MIRRFQEISRFAIVLFSLFIAARMTNAQARAPLETYPGDGVKVLAQVEIPGNSSRLRLVVGRFVRARNGKKRYLSVVTPGWGTRRKLLAGQWLDNGKILEAIDMGRNRCLILQSVSGENATRFITVEVKSVSGKCVIETETKILHRGIEAAALNIRQGVVFGYDRFANDFIALPLSGDLRPSSVLVCRSDLGLRNSIKRLVGRDLAPRRLTITSPADSPACFVCDVDRAGCRERISVGWNRGELVALAITSSNPHAHPLFVSPRGVGVDRDRKAWAAESSTFVDLQGLTEIINSRDEVVWQYSGKAGRVDLARVISGRGGAREAYRLVDRGSGEGRSIVARLAYGQSFATVPGIAKVVTPSDLAFLYTERPTVRPVIFVKPEVVVADLDVYLLWGVRTSSGEDRLLRFSANGQQLPLVDPVSVTKCDSLRVGAGGRLANTSWQAETPVPSGVVSVVVLQQVLIVSKSGKGIAASAVSTAVIGNAVKKGVLEMRFPAQWAHQSTAYREKAEVALADWLSADSRSLSSTQRLQLLKSVGK